MSCRILVVEDSATQAEALRSLLEEHEYEPVVARSAEAALELVESGDFDVLLSDVVMPGISGYELCRRLKQHPRWRELPVILLTSLADPMDIVQGLECGADNYITKPYDAEHLLARLRHVLDNRRLRRTSKTSVGVTVRFLGRDLSITSEKEQILDLFISSVEDVVRANVALQESQRALAEAHAQLEEYAREKTREARSSTERYRALLQNAGDAVLVLNAQGRILEANRRAADLFDRPAEELVNHPLVSLAPEEGRAELSAGLDRLSTERQVDLGELRFVDPDGNDIWSELTASVTTIDEELVLLIARDVTVRKEMDQRLYATNQRLQALVEASPLPILTVDREANVRLWNAAAERTFGWRAEEAIGRRAPFVPPDQMEESLSRYQRVLRGESVAGDEVSRVRKDGTPIELAIYVAPLRVSGGEVDGAICILADITERKRAEAAQREREKAERANLAKSEFLSRMSHELRTPLNAILGFAQLMELDQIGGEHEESVQQILRAGRHLLDLINEVLDLSRIEAGKLSLSLEPVAVDDAVREVLAMMRPVAAQSGIALLEPVGPASLVYVLADTQRLKQVILNFLSNGIKYNRAGGSVGVELSDAGGDWCRIAVRDTGPGIPADKVNRLYVPFDRLDVTDTGSPGTGLGLVLTKGLVEAMGGRIGLESTVGEGSTFWIELPRAEAPRLPDEYAHGAAEATEAAAPAALEKRRTVLYIEDNAPNLRLVERILAGRPNVRLLTAMQGSLGLELAREHHPDLILLDLNLPDLDAEEILLHLRGHDALRETPVVVVSADAMQGQVDRFLRMGVEEYLTKPLDVKRFLQVVDETLARR